MDQASSEMLDEILAKEPAALTDSDKGFLRARSSYLNEEQKSLYAEVLADQPESRLSTPEEEDEKAGIEEGKIKAPKKANK